MATSKPSNPKSKTQKQPASALAPITLLGLALIPLLTFSYLQPRVISNQVKSLYGSQPIIAYTQNNNHHHGTLSNSTSPIQTNEQLAAEYSHSCPSHAPKTHIFSLDPLIIYVENYLTPSEISYLLSLAVPYYRPSPVSKGYTLEAYDTEIRSSMSAVLPDDPVVACIEQRSVDFQGFMPCSRLEDIQVVKYAVGDHFRPHFDWFSGMANPRISTFFVYLACDGATEEEECQGGATQFPHFEGAFSKLWCDSGFVDCEDDSGVGGVAFKPVVGNAVFWSNLYANGTAGHPGVWHAGMPVKRGRKVGLNIFTRRETWVPEQK
ncbi:prolyl 4-hydroxylase subunit alpha-3 [Rhypophila decipiens]|uniref:Prolyl 4-hydroxylase subunit alpha-3 n=1 Tax=Rhypophila decipiens TaxID=261697 RepID=A0AAN6XZ43_9PEZI|nr:prolyl 4-hydroxylase subunit alpha-3 [Rhypophila decipiens]